MREISVIIFGMSHANSIRRASLSYTPMHPHIRISVPLHGNAAYPGGLVVYNASGEAMITPLLQRAIELQKARRDKPAVWVVSALGGNEANRLALFTHPEAFDFVDPEEPGCAPAAGARILPYELVHAQMREKLGWVRTGLELTARLGIDGLIQLGPIPPLRSSDDVKDALAPRTIEAARERGALDGSIAINDAAARRRMWKLEAAATRRICDDLGVEYLAPDNKLIGADGMRGPESAGDAIHGNEAWGAEVLRQIETYLHAKEVGDGN